MENIFEKEEHAKNIYVIRHKLSELIKEPKRDYYSWVIGPFKIQIYLEKHFRSNQSLLILEPIRPTPEFITQCETVDVSVFEAARRDGADVYYAINLQDDPRFNKYKPIMYNTFEGPNGIVNLSNGSDMPLLHLCELIRYLHRLANLTAFM